MLAYKWGLKTIYYSLINKMGSKAALKDDNIIEFTKLEPLEDDEACEACVL
jgi:hypothetical protein